MSLDVASVAGSFFRRPSGKVLGIYSFYVPKWHFLPDIFREINFLCEEKLIIFLWYNVRLNFGDWKMPKSNIFHKFRVRQFPHSLQCGNFSIFCQSFYVKSIICRDDRSTKTTVLFSNSLFSKTVTFMKFLPKMREREFPYFPHCVTATKFFFPSNQSILKFFSKTSIWRNFCDGARKNFVKSLYIQRSKKRNHFETRSSWKNFVKSLYLREDKKLQ